MSSDIAISLTEVTKRFGEICALDRVSFEIPHHCVFGLVGPNGAGKTTLFSLVAGFLKPTSGNIKVLGVYVEHISKLRGRLSILPQDAQFQSNVPVLDQLVFFSRLSGNSRKQAKKQAYLALSLAGLEDYAQKGARVLSHGMTKRLGIAQAFLGNPEVILLDEPTAGLDPVAAHDIRKLIEELKAKSTIVISSHDLSEIQRICNQVAILDQGRLVECNEVSEITQSDRCFRMTFSRPLSREEMQAIKKVKGVDEVEDNGNNAYTIYVLELVAAQNPEEIINEVVKELVVTGAVPRRIDAGVALESRFIQITQNQ